MTRLRRWSSAAAWAVALGAAVLVAGGSAGAQAPSKGPAEIIKRAQKGRADKEMGQAVQAADQAGAQVGQAAPAGDAEGEPGADQEAEAADSGDQGAEAGGMDEEALRAAHGGVDQATLRRIMGQGPPLDTAEASDDVPAGTVRVRVTDADGKPVQGAAVRLGIMEKGERKTSRAKVTDAEGLAVFDGLPTAGGGAYRVSVPYEGAQYWAPPFQLSGDKGYDVHITQLGVTHDPRVLLQFMGQSILELNNERLHVTQHAQLTNMSDETYVMPEGGLEVRLPAGFEAFQSQDVMGDQKLESTDTGFKLHGSIPPGPVTLAWAFDLPIHGDAVDFGFPIPFRTYLYRVVAQAAPGLTLDVSDMPPPEERETDAGPFLVTQVQRGPSDPPLEYVSVQVRGIPGPGPWRWFAVGGALAFLLGGVFLAARGGRQAEVDAKAREERKQRLLAEAVELEQLFARHEIGPQYHKRRMDQILTELAALLKQDERAGATQPAAAPAR